VVIPGESNSKVTFGTVSTAGNFLLGDDYSVNTLLLSKLHVDVKCKIIYLLARSTPKKMSRLITFQCHVILGKVELLSTINEY
jgi:hypothetical protein